MHRFSKVNGHHVFLMDRATKALHLGPNKVIVQSLETGRTFEVDKRYLGRITKTSEYFTKRDTIGGLFGEK